MEEIKNNIYSLAIRSIEKLFSKLNINIINRDIVMKNINPRGLRNYKYNIAFLVNERWNAVDCWLPVLKLIKKQHPECGIIGIFFDSNFLEKSKMEKFLYGQILDIADVLIVNNYSEKIYKKYEKTPVIRTYFSIMEKIRLELKKSQLKYSLKTLLDSIIINSVLKVGNEKIASKLLYDMYPKAIHVIHPHACFYGMGPGDGHVIDLSNDKARYITKTDQFIYITDEKDKDNEMRDIFLLNEQSQVIMTGSPRYDEWWIRYLKEYCEGRKSDEANRSNCEKICFFMPILFEYDRFSLAEREQISILIKNLLTRATEYFCILKFHPRDDIKTINQFVSDYLQGISDEKYIISSLQCMQLAFISDCVISVGFSSAEVDAVVARCPVIEFNSGERSGFYYKCYDGKYRTFLAKNNIVDVFYDIEKLQQYICQYKYKDVDVDRQKEQLMRYIPLNNNSSSMIADLLLRNQDV